MKSARTAQSRLVLFLLIAIAMTWIPTSLLVAQTSQPVDGSLFDTKAIKPPSRAAIANDAKPANSLDWQRLLMAMGIVMGLILVLKFLIGRMYPGLKSVSKAKIVKVLSRSAIAPKQQVILLQVGRRVVVVGDSGGQLGTLCEITDPDEVASLVGQIESTELTRPVTSGFTRLFGKAQQEFEEPQVESSRDSEPEQVHHPELSAAQTEISGLIDRMRTLTRVVRRDD